ncbi:TonB-dependent receptor [Sphingomonadaceae bacterium OTU29LAMAA1]|nr:TonB-dependent receptor [Sphingomonadaceae bacterium OTU29LAMAA1]
MHVNRLGRICGTTSFIALTIGLTATPAVAQTATAPEQQQSQTPSADSTATATPAATTAADQTPAVQTEGDDIVVTGFRASLNSALNQKRSETAAIDSIVAEDVGKFPDSNLAESMQRVPGVSLARGDGGEGRNISVRGLGAAFTRVRINGMEGSAQTGSSDIYGAQNAGRSFDFNVFPSEIFSALTVRKTPSADLEEGSLGATVDLRAPRPLDYKQDLVVAATLRGTYGELAKKVNPRASLLISKQFGDGKFGILASGSYQKRETREVGYSAVDILSANTNGLTTAGVNAPFCTPVGFTPVSPPLGTKGATASLCSTGNPRTSTAAAYNTVIGLRRPDLPNVQGSGAFLPRLPRYLNSEQKQERIGGSVTLQWAPDDATNMWIDTLYSRLDVTRRDNYIAAISFGRSVTNNGQPMTSVRDISFDPLGSLTYGLFDGVDVRSEGLVDRYVSSFGQVNWNLEHDFTDTFRVTMMAGVNKSILDGKKRLQTFIDAIDTDNFTIDYRDGGSTPTLGFGFDVANPANFAYAPALSDGTVLGGFSFQGRPLKQTTVNQTYEANFEWKATPGFKVRAGGQYRESDFQSKGTLPFLAQTVVTALPAGTSLSSITRQISGVDKLFGTGAPASWVAIDSEAWEKTFNFDGVRYCGAECGAGVSQIREQVTSAYAMGQFDTGSALPLPVRGDFGIRYVRTNQHSVGFIPVADATTPTGLRGQRAVVDRSYNDWLPSANVVFELQPELLLRVSGAKVMSRPDLPSLAPNSGVTATTRTGTLNNPLLDPIRANTADLGLEWYFKPGSLLSIAGYYKDIGTYVQRVSSQIPFNELGLPDALLANTNTAPTEIFNVSRPLNTPGGKLKGFEVNAQVQLDFLPGFLSNFGVLANYNRVTSKITYVLASVNGVATVTSTADLVGLSKNSASGTLYYEDKRFSIRGTASYRDRYIRGIPASPGSDLQGNRPNTFVDASASFNITDQFKLIAEVQNLTDERNSLYIDSKRQDTLFETRIGRTFTLGATARF